MKNFIGKAVFVALMATSAIPAHAQDVSGGIAVKNAYDLKMVRVSDKPVVQGWVDVTVPDTPCSVGAWGSIGAEEAGNELDVIGNCQIEGVGTFTLEAYELPGGPTFEIISPKFTTSVEGFNLTAQVMFVNDGEDGQLVSIEYPIKLDDRFTLIPGAHAGVAPYSGQEFVTADIGGRFALAEQVGLGGLIRYKIQGPDEGFEINVGVTYTFGSN